MISTLLTTITFANAAEAVAITGALGTDTQNYDSYDSPNPISDITISSRESYNQLNKCVFLRKSEESSEPISVEFTLDDGSSDISTIHILDDLFNDPAGIEVWVGDEKCYTFPSAVGTLGWSYIDCTGTSASDTVSIQLPVDETVVDQELGLCGVIVDTEDPADYYESFLIDNYYGLTLFDRSTCGDMAEDPDWWYMYLENYLEESETPGSYYLRHYCEADGETYTLSVRDGESLEDQTEDDSCYDPLWYSCSIYQAGNDAVPVLIDLTELTDDTYLMTDTLGKYANIGSQQNIRDFSGLRGLADREYQVHLGCIYTEDLATTIGEDTYYLNYFAYEPDTGVYDCLDFLQAAGFKYANLIDGECWGIFAEDAEAMGLEAILADESSQMDASDCDYYSEYSDDFPEDEEDQFTYGGASEYDFYELTIPEPESEEEEDEDETSASGYAIGIATAAIASAFVM